MRRTGLILLLALALAGAFAPAAAQDPAACPIATHSERIGGATIVYDEAGGGPAVLLLHGLFANKEQWNAFACLVAGAGYRAVAPDLPGYGKSEGFALADYQLERQVDLLHRFATRLSLGRFDVAGNSMGGAIAALYARRFPHDVKSLAFIGSPEGIVGWSPQLRAAIARGVNPFIPVEVTQLDLELGLLFVHPPVIPAEVKREIVADYERRNLHYVQVWNIANLYVDVLHSGPETRAPALAIWGEDDRIFNVAGAQRLQRRFPGIEVHALPDAGHLLHLENAAQAAPIYLEFLRAHAQAEAAAR